jgi:hypothetical protein
MQIQFLKKLQFTRLVKAGGRIREFNFLKYNKEPDPYFCVDTVDDRGNRIIFYMYDMDHKWKIKEVPGLPSWVYDAETQFQNMIHEEGG